MGWGGTKLKALNLRARVPTWKALTAETQQQYPLADGETEIQRGEGQNGCSEHLEAGTASNPWELDLKNTEGAQQP